MRIFLSFIWFLVYIKVLLFWLWLWQIKEYRLDRFLAHFETQGFEKIISSIWRLKYPTFTKKIIAIFCVALFGEIFLLLYFSFSQAILLTIFLTPILILFFQIPTFFWRTHIIKKATQKRAKFKNLLVIGITGSYGKTSTKEFLTTILSSKFKVLSTPAHQNTDAAIAQLILKKLTPDIEIFIVEMAAYKRGEIASPCKIVKPKIGILTGINEQHLSTFGSLENIIKTKYELIESLPSDGLAIFNGDNSYCYQLYKSTQKAKRVYSFQSTIANVFTDLYMVSLAVNRDFLSFKVVDKEAQSAVFKVNLLGSQNASNVLAAACCAKELGMSLEEIVLASQKIESWQGGVQLRKVRFPGLKNAEEGKADNLNIIDATYSINPDGVLSHLEYLKIWPGKKVIVMPCLIELGSASKEIHKEIGMAIADTCDFAIITTRDRFKEIGEGAVKKGFKEDRILFTNNSKEILEEIQNFCQPGDVVLLEGRVPNTLIQLINNR